MITLVHHVQKTVSTQRLPIIVPSVPNSSVTLVSYYTTRFYEAIVCLTEQILVNGAFQKFSVGLRYVRDMRARKWRCSVATMTKFAAVYASLSNTGRNIYKTSFSTLTFLLSSIA